MIKTKVAFLKARHLFS